MRFKGIALLGATITFHLLFINNTSHASVNSRSGEFQWSFSLNTAIGPQKLTYSSRSTYTGSFGLGWCSSFDYQKTKVGLFHCGRRIKTEPDDLREKIQFHKSLILTGVRITRIGQYQFTYKDAALIKIAGLPGEEWRFSYDEFNNLIKILKNGKKLFNVEYENSKDRVTRVTSEKCREDVNYKQSAKKRWITYQKTCQGRLIFSQAYEISYSRSRSGNVYIHEVKLQDSDKTSFIRYSESGEILHINLTRTKESS